MRLGPIIMDVEEQFAKLSEQIGKDLTDKGKISHALEQEARDHVQKRYPGSKHWDPSRINGDGKGGVDVDIAGAVRNYWDVDIYPVAASSLVFPTEEGKNLGLNEWRDIYNLLPNGGWFQPKGHDVIAAVLNGSLVALFHLSEHVFQERDPTLLPTDDEFCAAICAEVMK